MGNIGTRLARIEAAQPEVAPIVVWANNPEHARQLEEQYASEKRRVIIVRWRSPGEPAEEAAA